MTDIKYNFLENLQYKLETSKLSHETLSKYYIQLARLNNHFNEKEKETKQNRIKTAEKLNHQVSYRSVVDEFKALLKKNEIN